MIEKKITRDISKYEAKLFGPFTTRQILFGGPGIALGIAVFFLAQGLLGDTAMLLSVVVAAPFMLCGFWKPYNMPFEQFVKSVFVTIVMAPTVRKYATENTYSKVFPYGRKTVKKKGKSKSAEPDCQEV